MYENGSNVVHSNGRLQAITRCICTSDNKARRVQISGATRDGVRLPGYCQVTTPAGLKSVMGYVVYSDNAPRGFYFYADSEGKNYSALPNK